MPRALLAQLAAASQSEAHALDTLSLLTRSMYPMAKARAN